MRSEYLWWLLWPGVDWIILFKQLHYLETWKNHVILNQHSPANRNMVQVWLGRCSSCYKVPPYYARKKCKYPGRFSTAAASAKSFHYGQNLRVLIFCLSQTFAKISSGVFILLILLKWCLNCQALPATMMVCIFLRKEQCLTSKLKKFFKTSTYYLFRECSISLSILPLIKGKRKEKRRIIFLLTKPDRLKHIYQGDPWCTADWTAAWRPEGLKAHHKNFSVPPFKWTSRACFWDQSTPVSNKSDNKQSWQDSGFLPPKGLKNLSRSCKKPNLQGILFMCLLCYH